jgi:hypothetical protein
MDSNLRSPDPEEVTVSCLADEFRAWARAVKALVPVAVPLLGRPAVTPSLGTQPLDQSLIVTGSGGVVVRNARCREPMAPSGVETSQLSRRATTLARRTSNWWAVRSSMRALRRGPQCMSTRLPRHERPKVSPSLSRCIHWNCYSRRPDSLLGDRPEFRAFREAATSRSHEDERSATTHLPSKSPISPSRRRY